jgi:hypothetical protein
MSGKRAYGLWGNLSFAWVNAPIKKARKEELDVHELYLPDTAEAEKCYTEFNAQWNAITGEDAKPTKRPLLSTLLKLYGRMFFLGGVFKLAWSSCVICGAFYFVRSLLLYIDPKETDHPYVDDWTGWVLASGFFAAAALWGAFRSAHVRATVLNPRTNCTRRGLPARPQPSLQPGNRFCFAFSACFAPTMARPPGV